MQDSPKTKVDLPQINRKLIKTLHIKLQRIFRSPLLNKDIAQQHGQYPSTKRSKTHTNRQKECKYQNQFMEISSANNRSQFYEKCISMHRFQSVSPAEQRSGKKSSLQFGKRRLPKIRTLKKSKASIQHRIMRDEKICAKNQSKIETIELLTFYPSRQSAKSLRHQ